MQIGIVLVNIIVSWTSALSLFMDFLYIIENVLLEPVNSYFLAICGITFASFSTGLSIRHHFSLPKLLITSYIIS